LTGGQNRKTTHKTVCGTREWVDKREDTFITKFSSNGKNRRVGKAGNLRERHPMSVPKLTTSKMTQ